MIKPITLTDEGCDRATAYHMSNKIIRRDDGLFVTWLDVTYRIIVARVNPDTGEVAAAMPLAQGFDNHCGAAMAMSSDGRLHVVCGSHATGFLYRNGMDPTSPESWGLPEATGMCATYPSLVCDREDNLRLAHRARGLGVSDHWGVGWLGRMRGGIWQYGRLLARAPMPLYTYPTNSLAVGPDGTIHIVIEWYKTWPNNVQKAATMAISHLQTRDGANWFHTDGRPVCLLPVSLEDTSPVIFRGGANIRPGNLAVMPDGRPCFGVWDQNAGTLELAIRGADNAWRIIDLNNPPGDTSPRRFAGEPQVAPTPDGDIILAVARSSDGKWGGLDNEICVMRLDPDGAGILAAETIAREEPEEPDWLPSIEMPPAGVYNENPWLIWQTGRRREGCINSARTRVKLARLEI